MAKEFKPVVRYHCAVSLDNFVILIGGEGEEPLSTHEIWIYNLYTEEWRNHAIQDTSCAPEPFTGAVAAVIGETVYTFGGRRADPWALRNAVWKLSRTKEGCFSWSLSKPLCKDKSPSPRIGHSGWEYAGKLWIFAGLGHSPEGYLNNHGDTEGARNNQLLCFDPRIENWSNPQCFGSVPTPRCGHACAITKDTVWLFGGCSNSGRYLGDIFEFSMNSQTWNRIQTDQPYPRARTSCTLSVTDDKLVLHGGCGCVPDQTSFAPTALSDTWIMDLTSHSWRQYTARKDTRMNHTGSTGLNGVIIIGGERACSETLDLHDDIFYVMLEPKSLQQVAIQVILKHQNQLRVNCLPMKLLSLLGISDKQNHRNFLQGLNL